MMIMLIMMVIKVMTMMMMIVAVKMMIMIATLKNTVVTHIRLMLLKIMYFLRIICAYSLLPHMQV